jgi:tripartite-type tricarboxylate transporter receptor subunit TctC
MFLRNLPKAFGLMAAAAMVSGIALAPVAASAANFSGKTVTIVVPFKEGGSATRYGRTYQPFLQQHLPGNPKVVVLNKPGGGSILGANYFQSQKGDGLTLLLCSTSTMTSYLFGGKKVKYDPNSWRIVIANPLGTAIYARLDQTGITGSNIKNDIRALRKANTVFGAKHKTSAELRAFLAFDLLGFFPKPVFGLSTGKQRKAILRGELNLNYDVVTKYDTSVARWVKKGDVKMFMNLGVLTPDGKVIKDPVLGGRAPNILEAYKAVYGKEPKGTHWEVMKSFVAMGVTASKSLALPKGTSDDIYNTYLSAFKSIYKDKKFTKMIAKDMGKYQHYFGKDAQAIVKFATGMSEKNKKWMAAWIKKKFGGSS